MITVGSRLKITAAFLAMLLVTAALLPVTARAATTITEYGGLTASAAPYGITTGPDGALWFTEWTGNQIGRIDPTTHAVTEYGGLTGGSNPYGIVMGSDGALWFAEYGVSQIGRIDPTTHAVTEYGGLTGGSNPYGITSGPDGALWFAEWGTNQIGRMDPTTHVVNEYAVTGAPYEITSGPDGALWFTESSPSMIGRITTAGAVTEYGGLTGGSNPTGICTGPDGALWFPESNANQIGRIDPTTHTVTEYGGLTGGTPWNITSGPDGALWFTESASSQIGRMDPNTHAVTEYSTGNRPLGITSGPDGALWFTEYNANMIGRASTSIPVGDGPYGACANPATNKVYVANALADTVSVIDGSSASVIATLAVGNEPREIVVNPDTNKVYVANAADDTVSVINGFTDTVITGANYPIPVGDNPWGIDINSSTNKVYVANNVDDTVSVINGSTDTVITGTGYPIPVGGGPWGLSVNSTTNKIYVANYSDDNVSVINGSTDTVITGTGYPIGVGDGPEGVAVNSTTNKVYVANWTDNNVSVIDGANDTIVGSPIAIGNFCAITGVNPTTNKVFVTRLDGNITVINGSTDIIVGSPIPVGLFPYGIAPNPKTGNVYVTNNGDDSVSVLQDSCTPTTTGLGPDSANAGGAGFTLTVNGTGFMGSSVVRWNGEYRTTTFGSATQCTATIPATDIQTAGTAQVTVFTPGGGTSNAQTFDINNAILIPTVTTTAPSDITPTTATSGGNVTSDGGAAVTARGVCWSMSPDPTIAANKTTNGTGTGSFTSSLTGLTPNSTYHVRAYATNSVGTSYGADRTFDTPSTPPPPPPPPIGQHTWYLAEGTTAWGFSTYISIQNPASTPVEVTATYMPKGAGNFAENITLPANSQTTLANDHLIQKMGGTYDFSTKVEATDHTKTIAVDRTMEWGGTGAGGPLTPTLSPKGRGGAPEGHSSVGVTSPAKTWYLPEGSTNWSFETWLLIQNPSETEASCDVTYMIEGEGPKTVNHRVPANSRESYSMLTDVGNADASIKVVSDVPVIPERAMYRYDRREGHDSIGTTTPAADYYLAEGAVGYDSNYTTYVLVQNPQNSSTDVTVTYLTGTGQVPGPSFQMEPNSRKTVKVNDTLPPNTDVSTSVHGSAPIIAERAMYWDSPAGEACHDSVGMSTPADTFYLPDGQTSDGRETWTLVQNPNPIPVEVRISYLLAGGGTPVSFTDILGPNSRKTHNMADKLPSGRASILVESIMGGPIMCERAMYWSSRSAGTDTIGGSSE